jgi:hypothetical protein
MTNKNQDLIDQRLQDLNDDGVDRRGFLKCMAWAGTGLVWTMSGGIPASRAFASGGQRWPVATAQFRHRSEGFWPKLHQVPRTLQSGSAHS